MFYLDDLGYLTKSSSEQLSAEAMASSVDTRTSCTSLRNILIIVEAGISACLLNLSIEMVFLRFSILFAIRSIRLIAKSYSYCLHKNRNAILYTIYGMFDADYVTQGSYRWQA